MHLINVDLFVNCSRNARDIKVILGEHDRKRGDDGETTVVRLKKATMHPQFNLAKIEHDIGILELAVPVSTLGASIKTACIPTKGNRPVIFSVASFHFIY